MQATEKIVLSNDWVTLLLLFLLFCIVVLKLIDTEKVKEQFFSLLNFTLIEDSDVETDSFFNTFQVIIFLFSITVISLFVYQFKIYKIPNGALGFMVFLQVFGAVLAFFILKGILEYTLALLFMIKKRLQFFIHLKNNYLYSVAFLLYLALVLREYTSLNSYYIFFFGAIVFFVRFIFLVVRNKKLIFNKLFYFILYICALEIAPLFVLFKLMF